MTVWGETVISQGPQSAPSPESGTPLRLRSHSYRMETPEMPFSCDRQEQILFSIRNNVGHGMKRTFGLSAGVR